MEGVEDPNTKAELDELDVQEQSPSGGAILMYSIPCLRGARIGPGYINRGVQ